ncbi:hypothetical protein Hdeb2414_s0025g00658551 [Helianthus debilis subsp. tardiflorus]
MGIFLYEPPSWLSGLRARVFVSMLSIFQTQTPLLEMRVGSYTQPNSQTQPKFYTL